jgi:hypothetical protein
MQINPDLNDAHDDSHEPDDYLPMVDNSLQTLQEQAINPQLGATTTASTTTISGFDRVDLSQTFFLNSLAGANQTIYLDFDGHTTTGTSWNNSTRPEIITPAYDFDGNTAFFSDAELQRIQYIWQRVAEDFRPFNVNVTTQVPTDINDLIKSGSTDTRWGVRVVIGGSSYDWYGKGAGGVAYLNSFNWNADTPAFVFEDQLGNGNDKYTAEAISHEVGHTLGLNHDGRISPQEGYYAGQGTGETGWGTIMGVGYYKNLSQWSKGEYTSASNTEDDLAIITTKNGFGYRTDDAGNSINTAKALTISNVTVSGTGIIERNTDVDFYSFSAGVGDIDLYIDPVLRGANLDILAELYSADGTLIAVSNPTDRLAANIKTTLTQAGAYYLKIDGVGNGDPLVTGYTDYGSLGEYSISGTIVPSDRSIISLALSTATILEDGTSKLVYTFTRAGDTSNPLTVKYGVGGTATFGSDYTQTGAASFTSNGGTINFAAGSNTATLTIAAIADSTIEADETIALTLVSDPTYAIASTTAVTGTIINDDTPVITLALAGSSVMEDGTEKLIYTFTRTANTSNPLVVKYAVGGTATLNTDYTETGASSFTDTAGTITFAAGANNATLAIDPNADISIESNETVALTLVGDSGYIVGTTSPVIGTITNDDIPLITLALANTSVMEDGNSNLVYTFTRNGDVSSALTVNYRMRGSANSSSDYTQIGANSLTNSTGKITFAAGATTAVLTIDPTADTTIENNESVGIQLTSGSNYAIGTTSTIYGTILDDDKPVITLALAANSVLEDGTNNLEYTFARTGDLSQALTVNYTVSGTATLAGNDYTQMGAGSFTGTTGSITFAAGASTAKLAIDPTADTTLEKNETVGIKLASNSAYKIGTTSRVTGTIANDELSASAAATVDDSSSVRSADSTPKLVLNLTQISQPTAKVSFAIEREAAYNNSVGFYQALDTDGSIQTSNGILKPADAGYIQAALQNALLNAEESGLHLSAENRSRANVSVNLDKAFYLPILVTNGTLAEAANGYKLSSTYTAFAGANADKIEHIRLLGNNIFGFEDTFGGGDRDYNDLVITAAIG